MEKTQTESEDKPKNIQHLLRTANLKVGESISKNTEKRIKLRYQEPCKKQDQKRIIKHQKDAEKLRDEIRNYQKTIKTHRKRIKLHRDV